MCILLVYLTYHQYRLAADNGYDLGGLLLFMRGHGNNPCTLFACSQGIAVRPIRWVASDKTHC